MCIETFGMIKISSTTVIIQKPAISKFKDEASSIPMTEIIGLRSKMYSYTKENNKESRTPKGIKKITIKKNINHNNYN